MLKKSEILKKIQTKNKTIVIKNVANTFSVVLDMCLAL